jgi:hypothetical protein
MMAPSVYVQDTDCRGRPKQYIIDYTGQIVSNMMPTRDVVREAAKEVNSQADPSEPSNTKDSEILKNNPKATSTAEQLRIYKSGEDPYEIMPGTKTPEPLIQYNPVTQNAEVPATEPVAANNVYTGAMGSTNEEFCYPNGVCYTLSEPQQYDSALFNEVPRVLSKYASNNNLDFTELNENGYPVKLDLSKVTKDDVVNAIKNDERWLDLSGVPIGEISNLDDYADQWLKYQQANQKAYGNTDYDSFWNDDAYSDWLNVTGTPGEDGPNDIWTTVPLLKMQQKQYGGASSEMGGFVSQESPLYKFIYGGDDVMIPYNEQDLPMAQDGGGPGWQYYTDWLFEKPTKIYKPGEDPYEITSTPLPEELISLNDNTDSRTTDGPLVRKAQLNYVPRYKTTSGGLFRTLAPWNPAMSYAGSWAKQMTLPYMAGTATPYGGGMEGLTPVARQVTKSGLLGRPKKWTDYYATPGMSGTQLYRSSTGELQGFNPSGTGLIDNAKPGREERESTTPGERYGVDKETWDAISAKSKGAIKRGYRQGQRNERRAERAEEKEKFFPGGSILNNSTDDNPFNTQSACPPGYFKDPASGLCKNFAGEVSPSTQASTAAATFQSSAQAQMNTNPFQATGTNAVTGQDYAYTKDGQLQKNNLDPVSDLSQQSELVGVDYKRKDMRNFDPESALNQFNAGARGVLNFVDKLQNRGKENTMLRETTGIENIASEQTPQFRGDWVDYGSQLGQYRFNDMGQNRSSFSSYGQKGGFMQTGGYTQDDEVYMTDEEIADFIANGGEIEYL